MKRIIIYCLLLAAVLVIPVEKLDVGKLEPVQAVWMYKQGNWIVLETDTQDRGVGRTVEEALSDLEEHCLGIIYLDTAQFLLVSENAVEQITEVQPHLKRSVELCQWDGKGSVADAAIYMTSHENGYPIKDWKEGVQLPILHLKKIFEKNVEKSEKSS